MAKQLPTHARVVIIGGGIAGCSTAYHLTKLGWSDVVLLERKTLTCGTTWHAAGLVREVLGTYTLSRLAKYSMKLFQGLEAETGQAIGLKQNGSIGVATNEARCNHRAAFDALNNLRDAGIKVSANTQINRLSMPEMPRVLDDIIAAGIHSWQIQLTVAMGRAADEPEILLQPYDLLDLFPMLAELKGRCDAAKVRLWPGNNIGYFGPYESTLRGTMPRGHMASCGAGRVTLGIEADGAIKGCPSLPTEAWTGGNIRDASLQDI